MQRSRNLTVHISSKQPEAKRNAGPVGTGKETAPKKEIGIPGAYPRSMDHD